MVSSSHFNCLESLGQCALRFTFCLMGRYILKLTALFFVSTVRSTDCEPAAAAGHPGPARGHGSESRGPVLHSREEGRQC